MLRSTILFHAEENIENKNYRFSHPHVLEKEINWDEVVEAIFPHYVASEIKPLVLTIESMLRIYYLQKLYNMSATEVEYVLYKIDVLREFALIDLDYEVIPNASCIEDFSSLLIDESLSLEIEQAFNIKHTDTENSVEI